MYYQREELFLRRNKARRIAKIKRIITLSAITASSVSVLYLAATQEDAVAKKNTRTPVVKYSNSVASCYGGGLYGNRMANGQVLTTRTVGVAHRTLPLGSKISIRGKKRTLVFRVTDRMPYHRNRQFDITEAGVRKLGVSNCRSWGVRSIKWRRVR